MQYICAYMYVDVYCLHTHTHIYMHVYSLCFKSEPFWIYIGAPNFQKLIVPFCYCIDEISVYWRSWYPNGINDNLKSLWNIFVWNLFISYHHIENINFLISDFLSLLLFHLFGVLKLTVDIPKLFKIIFLWT